MPEPMPDTREWATFHLTKIHERLRRLQMIVDTDRESLPDDFETKLMHLNASYQLLRDTLRRP